MEPFQPIGEDLAVRYDPREHVRPWAPTYDREDTIPGHVEPSPGMPAHRAAVTGARAEAGSLFVELGRFAADPVAPNADGYAEWKNDILNVLTRLTINVLPRLRVRFVQVDAGYASHAEDLMGLYNSLDQFLADYDRVVDLTELTLPADAPESPTVLQNKYLVLTQDILGFMGLVANDQNMA